MARLIREIRAPHEAKLAERLAVSESLLYRRGNFNGTFDESSSMRSSSAPTPRSRSHPGSAGASTIVPGQAITLEDVYAHTALTYPNTWVREMTGAEIHRLMEDVADNLFHPDPYYRQGGDMVRLGGLTYAIDPGQADGQAHPGYAGRRPSPRSGAPLQGHRWASLGEADGPPVWDVVAAHLRRVKRVTIDPRPRVRVVR